MDRYDHSRVFVLGGGHQGLSMAAHLALNGEQVTLWNRTQEHIQDIIRTNTISCTGLVTGQAHIARASSNLADVISDFIMVTVPSNAQQDVARMLAPYAHRNMIVVLNPGRTFGAFEFARVLKTCGCTTLPHIAEAQTIVYTCRRGVGNDVSIYALKHDVEIASLEKDDIMETIGAIPACIRDHFKPVDSVMRTSLSNVGMVLHCAPILLNTGWIENDVARFKYYYDGITQSVAQFLEKLDDERMRVAEATGYRVESTAEWLRRSYGVSGDSLYECIQNNACYHQIDAPFSIRHRYLLEDIPCGLVPMEDAGRQLGVDTPIMSLVIDLANAMLNTDFRINGRKFCLEWLHI